MTNKTNNPHARPRIHIPTVEDLHLPNVVKRFFEPGEPTCPQDPSRRRPPYGLVLTTGYNREAHKNALINDYILTSDLWRGNHNSVHILSHSYESIFEYADNDIAEVVTISRMPGEIEDRDTLWNRTLRFRPSAVIFGDILTANDASAVAQLSIMNITVFASIPAYTSAHAIHNLVHLFPVEERDRIQEFLGRGLLGVLSQTKIIRVGENEFTPFEVLNADESTRGHILNGEFLLIDEDIKNGDPDKMLDAQRSFDSVLETAKLSEWVSDEETAKIEKYRSKTPHSEKWLKMEDGE